MIVESDISITLGVSSCLLGEHVRFDGGHKLDYYISNTLGRYFRLLPVCPEVGCGLPVPREAMHLEGDPASPRLITGKTRIDLTVQMLDFCNAKVKELEREELCGFIFKKNSPSCGIRVKAYKISGAGDIYKGLFAAEVTRHFPMMPVAEEEQLTDPLLRNHFIQRVLSYSDRSIKALETPASALHCQQPHM